MTSPCWDSFRSSKGIRCKNTDMITGDNIVDVVGDCFHNAAEFYSRCSFSGFDFS